MKVPYALSVHGPEEVTAVCRAISENRLAPGSDTIEFENRVADLFGKRYGVMTNSGSSANLLALELLGLPEGSDVITPALTFATTVAPILQKRLKPVFVDVELGTYLPSIDSLHESALWKFRTPKAMMIPSLIGNVPNFQDITTMVPVIEDSCDTIGARLNGYPTGTYSEISTTSFYGSHIITAGGGGGMLCVNRPAWRDRARVLRGWGRSSSVVSTDSENLEMRFNSKIGDLDYDAKFIFQEAGYNFQSTELCAAFGLAQLDRLPYFSTCRKKNFARLLAFFKRYEDLFILPIQTPDTETNWLAFPLTVTSDKFTRKEITLYLEQNGIQTRPVFTGNILRQPGFSLAGAGEFPNADYIMERAFLIGCHQGLSEDQLNYMEEHFEKFLGEI